MAIKFIVVNWNDTTTTVENAKQLICPQKEQLATKEAGAEVN